MLKESGVHTHLVTDHYHYYEDGGVHYHTKYNTWEFFRGQEGDPWIGQVAEPDVPENINRKGRPQDWINREYMDTDAKLPITQSFNAGLDYIKRNMNDDNWFLQLETFDPHEPFFTHREHKDRYAEHYDNYTGPKFDWPGYEKVTETPDQVEHAKYNYASLLSLCDKKLGDILDLMDANNMWDDTMLVVCTDHGFMFGEHDCWAKNWMPLYEEVAHTPFFVWDPRYGKRNERRQALVQPCLDLAPTLLGLFNLEIPTTMTGKDLAPAIADDTPVRDAAIFGYHGCRVNITDGKYVYMRGNHKAGVQMYQYGLTAPGMKDTSIPNGVTMMTDEDKWDFMGNYPILQMPANQSTVDGETAFNNSTGDMLFDVTADPAQKNPLDDKQVIDQLSKRMSELLGEVDAPAETYERLGLAAV
tara:strand:+ start:379 stop:1623 length:1245 start_codon:yes stop_codon:yes gene_type:complete